MIYINGCRYPLYLYEVYDWFFKEPKYKVVSIRKPDGNSKLLCEASFGDVGDNNGECIYLDSYVLRWLTQKEIRDMNIDDDFIIASSSSWSI